MGGLRLHGGLGRQGDKTTSVERYKKNVSVPNIWGHTGAQEMESGSLWTHGSAQMCRGRTADTGGLEIT